MISKRLVQLIVAILLLAVKSASPLSLGTAASAASALKDHSGAAAGLFNNMRTPAALISGAIIPLGILTAPDFEEGESKRSKLLKKANLLLAMSSLLSELLAITYSTVAINKLAEVQFHPTSTVSELIMSQFELAWIGTNVHFLLGMFGFGLLVGSKAYFKYGEATGKIAGSLSIATFLQCTSVVNRGIAMGQGHIDHIGFRFANNLFSLTMKYVWMVLSRIKKGPLPVIAIGFFLYSTYLAAQLVVDAFRPLKD